MAELILITGGARSGKSSAALRLADGYHPRVLIATAEPFDGEMRDRIARHRSERDKDWRTIEEPLDLAAAVAAVPDPGAVLVVDCLTVWLANLLHHGGSTTEDPPACAALLESVRSSPAARIVLVTNEVGMGIVPEHPLGRCFRDMAGRLNQRVAASADRVLLAVCGQLITVKPARKEIEL